ncbi:zinc ABC transporter substrate-binding protein [Desulfuromonas versatilis]|uniref:Zinc ABC transporter substrate-binding protein n=1 Tax=Desulfuromonas versatilis TaxID=2802975 RepID=A0ABM8HUA2_9BACT|nr:zinc ABC transporter substrate-binding protein [Desulfuromonas versatilis]BCR04222.1 zinc ABC transporter substrate-binding protein [Desulfuromonas versatilis]
MPTRIFPATLLLALLAMVAWPAAAASPPKVVVTIKPIHSLAAAVMAGVASPQLLIEGGGSPHSYSLRPSDARALNEADLVVWVGEGLESFMQRTLAALGEKVRVLTLARAPGVKLLPSRAGGAWEASPEHPDEHDHDHHASGDFDYHLWLDPNNALAIAELLATELGRLDPAHREAYASNAQKLAERLRVLDAELEQRLEPLRKAPYVVFHDGYQPLEKRYDLNAVGAITVSPDRKPGARRLREIRATIGQLGARCVFSEPQFEPRLAATVIEGTGARAGVLDPLGADLPAGPEAYFVLMRNLAEALETCLKAP